MLDVNIAKRVTRLHDQLQYSDVDAGKKGCMVEAEPLIRNSTRTRLLHLSGELPCY